MIRAGDSTSLAVLGRRWRRWTAVVEQFARGRCRVSSADYDALYRELLEACRALARTGDTKGQARVRRLKAVVRPWLSARVLARTDRDLLFDLLGQCRRIDRELNGPDWAAVARAWVRPVTAGVVVAILIAFVTYAATRMSRPLNDWLDAEWRAARIAVADFSIVERIMMVGAILTPIMLVWMYHTRKS